ncbi:DNA helicase [Elysia marginata]|uniref:DNA replication licensing factor MCM5 n=1 Tax=Elysia marginata TaxID=1093978 RepID=A0AAV4EWG1_9GAST|nr:DNA helicase [Elysia marginata]
MEPGFDDAGIFYSDNFGPDDQSDDTHIDRQQIKRRLKEFIRVFHEGNFSYRYRDQLKRHYNLKQFWLEVDLDDVNSFDESLGEKLLKQPSEHLPLFEDAAKEVVDEITRPRPEGEEEVEDIQVMLTSASNACSIRELKSDQMSRLVKIPGIVIAASAIRSKAIRLALQCRGCANVINNIQVKPGLEGYAMPRKCNVEQAGRPKCPVDPYFIIPDKCRCVDFQTLKLQEAPEDVPNGELPRHLQLYCDRYLCDRVVPGNRVTIMGVYSIKRSVGPSKVKSVTSSVDKNFFPVLPDGLTRRGDINVLMLGDPGTAKSQLLKFVERCSPIGVYTSGKGSSAAGLTASVMRDPHSRGFVMEGGAMVLADGGVVCIDEFDKMREDDRVAIHEAMEQQTISIAKAGITTTLNSRCSVLAAANSVFGRWDDTKGGENIDFMPTILSRFDMIFIVKDEHDEQRDMTLAKHVMNVHLNALQSTEAMEGEIPLNTLKKYIAYARSKCGPRLSPEAAEKLKNRYVLMRNNASDYERETGKKVSIPITVRQLEAIIRMSESQAKMRLAPFASEADVDEALRLFQVSTLDAATSGNLAGAEGFTTDEDQELLSRIEKQIKRRFVIGSQVSEHAIIQDFMRQVSSMN